MRCKNCNAVFIPKFFNVKYCAEEECRTIMIAKVLEKQKASKLKAQRKDTKQKKEVLKSKSDHLKDTQTVFNKFIRLRDALEPCISHGEHYTGQYHAGHFRSTGSTPELRFNEDNVHKQCSVCNNHKHGNLIEYRINLIKKIGIDRVEKLEGKNELNHYSIEDLKDLQILYKKKIKDLAL